jgi:sporulation protein YlmC with PRC-barrel domain
VELVGRNAYIDSKRVGSVRDFYLSLDDPEVLGIIVTRGFKSRPVRKGSFTFDGKRYTVDPLSKEEKWKPVRGTAIKFSRVKGKEVFAGPGWKIGRLNYLQIAEEKWKVTGLEAEVEHQLIMNDVGDYRKLRENTSLYDFKRFYADAYSLKPGKIVEQMGDSDKARFLTDSGDSSIRGLGGASSMIMFPSLGMSITESGTVILPIDAKKVEEITIRLVNQGTMWNAEDRKNILRRVFEEYYGYN